MSELKNLVCQYDEDVKRVLDTARKLGSMLTEILREVVPDIVFSIGWEEGGVDSLCFYSRSKAVLGSDNKEDDLELVLSEVFRKYCFGGKSPRFIIECPFGVYVTEDEAKRIEEILIEKLK